METHHTCHSLEKEIEIAKEFKEHIERTGKEVQIEHHPGFSTKCVHGGQEPDPIHGALMTPISLSSTFAQKSPGVLYSQFDYSRCGNPTRDVFEKLIAECEYGKHGLAFSSGCAAMTCILLLLNTGDHVICCDDVYGGTQRYMRKIAEERIKIKFTFVDMTKPDEVEKAFTPETKLVWIETPTNPTLKICDVRKMCELAKTHNSLSVVDNTFASPYLQSPLLLGADICLNSCTKYIGGHSDLVMGSITLNSQELRDKLFFNSKSFGGCPSPFDCYLAIRGMKTLKIRMEQHCKAGLAVAKFLEAHPKVEKVIYPGLSSHPQYELAKTQMRGSGGMITFYVKGGLQEAQRLLENVKLFACAESLGGVESLIESPAIMTHASVPVELRKGLGISDTLVRLSCGVEDIEDLLYDLKQAFERV